MEQAVSQLVKLIDHIPPNVNPYLAAANMLEASTRGPDSPLWLRRFRVSSIALLGVIVVQAAFLLFQRARLQRPKIVFNDLGLVIADISWISAIVYLSYGPVTIFVLLLIHFADAGYTVRNSTILLIFGIKFFPIILGSWALIWICACQCASILWTSLKASGMNRRLLRGLIRWGFSISFILLAFGPLPFITWVYVQAYFKLRKIESISQHVNLSLRSVAPGYDPNNFNKLGFLSLLMPAREILSLEKSTENYDYIGLKLYCGVICTLICIHVPLLWLSLRGLYRQSVPQSAIDAALGSGRPLGKPKISRELRQERRRLVLHAACVFFSTTVHLPPVVWKMTLVHTPEFLLGVKGKELSYSGLTIPLSITGNIILLILNAQAHQLLLKKTRNRDATFLCISLSQSTPHSTNPTPLSPEKSFMREDMEEIDIKPIAANTPGSQPLWMRILPHLQASLLKSLRKSCCSLDLN